MTTLAEALAPKSDQLNADDLIPGPRTLKITSARISKEDRQTKIVLNYEGDQGKPWKPCKTMGRAMVMVWAITDEAQLVGKSIRVYRDPEVKFGDQGAVGGIRISHMSDIEKPASVKLTVSQGKKSIFNFHPLVTAAAVDTKPITIEQARLDIETAASLADLKTVWSRKIMAPYRDALQSELDDRKAALAFDDKPAELEIDHAHRALADTMLRGIKAAKGDADVIGEIMDAQSGPMAEWPNVLKVEVYDAKKIALGQKS